jgi:PAS domain-containing protein
MTERIATKEIKKPRTLADAIVDTVREPLVVLDRDLRVVAASRSFYQAFGVIPDDTQGRLFYELANGQWSIPALRKLLEEVIPKHRIVEAYEIEHDFASVGRRTLLRQSAATFYNWRSRYGGMEVSDARRPHRSLGGLTPNEFAARSRWDHIENRVQL